MALVPITNPEWPTTLQDEMVLNGSLPTAADLRTWEDAVRYLAAYPWPKPATCCAGNGASAILTIYEAGTVGPVNPDSLECGVQMHPWATDLQVYILAAAEALSSDPDDRVTLDVSVSGAEGFSAAYDSTLITPSIEHASWQSGTIRGIGTGLPTDEATVRVVLTNNDAFAKIWLFGIQFRQAPAPVIRQ